MVTKIEHINKVSFLIIACFLILTGCEKEFNIDIPFSGPNMVVEGWIEQGDYAHVILTATMPYFSAVDSSSWRDLILTRAKVSVSDGTETEVLTLEKNDSYFPPFIYRTTKIKGEIGKKYYLTIEYQGEIYTAETSIPQPVKFDSIWFELEKGQEAKGYGFIGIKLTDDGSQENYYRILTKRRGKDVRFSPTNFSTYGDKGFNGRNVSLYLYRSFSNFKEKTDSLFYNDGDTVSIKLSSIDKSTFDFWRTLENETINSGNPFASPNFRIKTNISGGLGIWAGYGTRNYILALKENQQP